MSSHNPDLRKAMDERFTAVNDSLAAFIENSGEASIHEARIAIRRLESAYRALPSKCRTRSSEKHLRLLRVFFRQTSDIRDYDVISEKLLKQSLPMDDFLMQRLAELRSESSREARRLAKSLSGFKSLHLRRSGDGLTSNYNRRICKLAKRFLVRMPPVLAHESGVEAIHALRKVGKKLYYTLELKRTSAHEEAMTRIRQLHTLSGNLHDCDVAMAFLNSLRGEREAVERLLSHESQLRHALYSELHGLLSGEDWTSLLHCDQEAESTCVES